MLPPRQGVTLNASLLGPAQDDQACWRDYEIRLGEEEGRKAAVDRCHMLFRRATAASDSLPVQGGRPLRPRGQKEVRPWGHLNTGLRGSRRDTEMPPASQRVFLPSVKHVSVSPAKGEFNHVLFLFLFF